MIARCTRLNPHLPPLCPLPNRRPDSRLGCTHRKKPTVDFGSVSNIVLMESAASTEGLIPKPVKKSLFNRPAGRKAPPQTTSTSETLFERSKQSFDAIVAERQRKCLAKEARQKKQQVDVRQELDGAGLRKKRRVSDDADGSGEGNQEAHNGNTRYVAKRTSYTVLISIQIVAKEFLAPLERRLRQDMYGARDNSKAK